MDFSDDEVVKPGDDVDLLGESMAVMMRDNDVGEESHEAPPIQSASAQMLETKKKKKEKGEKKKTHKSN